MELGLEIGDGEWELALSDWGFRLGTGIGIGVWIKDWDWGLGFLIGMRIGIKILVY